MDRGMDRVFLATKEGNLKKLTDLFNGIDADPREISIHLPDPDGLKPIHIASKEGHLDIVKYLVSHGAEVAEVDRRGNAPLHYAASGGHLYVVRYLVSRGAEVEMVSGRQYGGKTPLELASSNGHRVVVEYLSAEEQNLILCTLIRNDVDLNQMIG